VYPTAIIYAMIWASLVAQAQKNMPALQETQVQPMDHSSILA